MITEERYRELRNEILDHILESKQAEFKPLDVMRWIRETYNEEDAESGIYLLGVTVSHLENWMMFRLIERGLESLKNADPAFRNQVLSEAQERYGIA